MLAPGLLDLQNREKWCSEKEWCWENALKVGVRKDKGTKRARKLTLRWRKVVGLRRRRDNRAVHVVRDQLEKRKGESAMILATEREEQTKPRVKRRMEIKKSKNQWRKKQTIKKNKKIYKLVLKINKIDTFLSLPPHPHWHDSTGQTHTNNLYQK